MQRVFLSTIVFLFTMGSLTAQNFIGKINPFPVTQSKIVVDDTIKILAVMVNFQEDKDAATFGNGKFGSIYSSNYGTDIIDPLPHDKSYFEDHLTFVKNYFHKVSEGKTSITFVVMPDTLTVSKTMRNYSPSNDFTPLAEFSAEVWNLADQKYPGFNFSDYDVFLIFHAGVGRDITLPGSLGNERDLPSVFLNENSFKNIYGNNFDGFPVSGGSFKIKNSMIIPETESREIETISGKYLFQISINGLLAASVASYMGLPDLFDTNTGLSAIGRFGLMDGQAIFAYNGLFPPEPSAWEKIYLGWKEPVELSPGNYNIDLITNLASSLGDTVILKVPLNSSEYYLIENRQRDAFKDGARLLVKSNGITFTRTFLKDTTGFYSYDTDSLSGVILDIDEYDWALPGNGIVIWHIDENVINEKLAENKINADKTRRGVDVEEADGVQDIGEKFITIFGDEVIGEGTALDFWYAGNKSVLYKNRFSKDTRPDTRTNTGANSLITIKDFSQSSNKMSFKIEYGDSVVKPLFFTKFQNLFINKLTLIDDNPDNPIFGLCNADLVLTDGKNIIGTYQDFTDFYKVPSIKTTDKIYTIGAKFNHINYLVKDSFGTQQGSFLSRYAVSTAPVLRKNIDNTYDLIVGTTAGVILIYDLESITSANPLLKDSIIVEPLYQISKISASSDEIFAIATKGLNSDATSYFFSTKNDKIKFDGVTLKDIVSSVDKVGNYYSVLSDDQNKFYVVSDNEIKSSFEITNNEPISSFSLADIKQDGNNYILINNGNKSEAYNLTGALADNFALLGINSENLRYDPLVADIEGNSIPEVLISDFQGNLFAFDAGSGKLIPGFPLSFGNQNNAQSVLFNYKNKTAVAGITQDGTFAAWQISSVFNKPEWAEENGDNQNASFVQAAKNSNSVNQFFPANRAYNYPNPVYNGQTAIRYFVSEDSKINIKIFDLAGSLVSEMNDEAKGGFDNETVWNVSEIQSGVYLARIEAFGSSGKSESTVIKIAVVK